MGTTEALDSFGEWLRQRRTSLGLTRPELAGCAGCSVSALRKIESDERRPSRQLAKLLADCLQISPDEKLLFLDASRGVRRVARLGAPVRPTSALPFPLQPSPEPLGLAASAPPAGTKWSLPCPATPLVGREAELGTLAHLLADSSCRLLTLVGPGGIGKTRLAVEVSCNVYNQFADGVFFAPLAATRSPEFVAPTIAQSVGLTLSGPADPRNQLADFLRGKRLLLLIDNLEHLLQGVGLLSALLEAAPGLTLLATSRERLELQGEWVFEVQGLPVATESQVEAVESYSAVQLFVQRARRARVDFELSPEDLPQVVHICQMVEGMPLAIELAAAWVPVLTCAEIAREIEQGLDILATRLRDVPERQRSLRAVFDYSWELLNQEEQKALGQLSIFRGGFEREAAQVVAGASLPLLSALVGSSFLRRGSEGRFTLHELVRQYAGGRLLQAPEEEMAARQRHSAYFAAFVARLEKELMGTRQHEALTEFDAEIDNVRAGWHWALERRDEAALTPYVNGLMHYYRIRSWHGETNQVCARAIEVLKARESHEAQLLLARVQAHQATALQYRAQLTVARRLLESSLDTARRLGSQEDIAHTLMKLGAGAVFGSAAHEAMDYFRQALDIYEAIDDDYGKLWALQELGWAAWSLDEVELAQQYHYRSLPLLRERGPQSLLVWTLLEIGSIHRELGAYADAQRYLGEARAVGEEIGYYFALLSCLIGLGQTAELVGQYQQAQDHYQAAAALRRHLGDVTDIATALALLVRVAVESGDVPQSATYLQELQAFAARADNVIGVGYVEYGCAELALAQRQLEAAEQHFRQCVTVLRSTRRRAIALLAILRTGQTFHLLGDDERAEAWFRDGLQEAWKRSSIGRALEAIGGLSAILARRGEGTRAAELATFVQQNAASSWEARQQTDALLKELRDVLSEDQVAAALQRGRSQSLETVIAGLLRDSGPRPPVSAPV